jgi:hypothetical protein
VRVDAGEWAGIRSELGDVGADGQRTEEVLERRDTPGRGETGDVEGVLDRDRESEEWTCLASCTHGVGLAGQRTVEVAHADGVDRCVVLLDPIDRRL